MTEQLTAESIVNTASAASGFPVAAALAPLTRAERRGQRRAGRLLRSQQVSLAAGKAKSVPVYYEGQNTSGTCDHWIAKELADELKNKGEARPINRGTAILILKVDRPTPTHHRDSEKSRWVVAHQTSRRSGPGEPRWELQ